MSSPASSTIPALLVAGARSGCGKTTIALALMAALVRRGLAVQAFKTGPDFIDSAWHSAMTGRPAFNLDFWMFREAPGSRPETPPYEESQAHKLDAASFSPLAWQFRRAARDADAAVIEGAMGLFDGLPGLPASAADVALQLGIPVLLVLDCRGAAATAAAVAQGLASFRPELPLLGAVCTFVNGPRHADLLRRAFEAVPSIPLLGLFPRDEALRLPSRHLGLVSAGEGLTPAFVDTLVRQAELHLDLDGILRRAARCDNAAPLPSPRADAAARLASPVRIAVAHDEAFSFWYPEHNILLTEAGAVPVPFSPLRDSGLPDGVQGLILPGGYPELHAARLSANVSMREAIRAFAHAHPVYGECGGYVYLMDFLEDNGKLLPLCGCLPLTSRLESGRAALGYREVSGLGDAASSPWAGLSLRGHEFHYTRIVERPDNLPHLWAVRTPAHPDALPSPEGVALGNVSASYVHLCWLSHPFAALRFAEACRRTSRSLS